MYTRWIGAEQNRTEQKLKKKNEFDVVRFWSRKEEKKKKIEFLFHFSLESMYLALFAGRSFAYRMYMMYTYLYSRTKRTLLRCKNFEKKESIGICVLRQMYKIIQKNVLGNGQSNGISHFKAQRTSTITHVFSGKLNFIRLPHSFTHSLKSLTSGGFITMCVSRELADEFGVTSIY